MKRLLKKLLIFCIPFVLLFVLFFSFETYNYFGFKEDLYQSAPLASMRRVVTEKPTKIILGDSRAANLNEEYVREISGENFTRLAYGGAQLGESIDMFWWAADYAKLEKVVFVINFYTSGGSQTGENKVMHVENAKAAASNPFKFAMNMNYWLEAVANAKNTIMNPIHERRGEFDKISERENPSALVEMAYDQEAVQNALDMGFGEKWNPYMEYYASELIYPPMRGFELQQATKDALQEIIDYCELNSIDLVFVFPPVHEVIYERVIWQLDDEITAENKENGTNNPTMTEKLQEMKDFLIERTTVYDLEIRSDFTSDPESFYDGFHMMLEGKILFARLLFTDTEEHPEMIHRYIRNGVVIVPGQENLAYEKS